MIKKFRRSLKRNRRFYLLLLFTAFNTFAVASPVYAGDFINQGGAKLMNLIIRLDLVVSALSTSWGILEAQLGYPNWKQKVVSGVVGFIAISLLPWFFQAINSALNN